MKLRVLKSLEEKIKSYLHSISIIKGIERHVDNIKGKLVEEKLKHEDTMGSFGVSSRQASSPESSPDRSSNIGETDRDDIL